MKSLSPLRLRSRRFVLGTLVVSGIYIVSYFIEHNDLLIFEKMSKLLVLPSNVSFSMGKIRRKTDRYDINKRNGSSYLTLNFPNETVYINSAMVGNSTPGSGWDLLMLTVWSSDISDGGRCCALYKNGSIVTIPIFAISNTVYNFKLKGRLLQCKIPNSNQQLRMPIAASVAVPGSTCSSNTPSYYPVDLVYKETHPESIGLCTKSAYGTIDGKFLIEWFEVHKYLGVDAVYTHIDSSLNGEAKKVFAYYQSKGMLITKKFDLPSPVYMYMEKKNSRAYSNGGMAIKDCMEHLRGYTYVSIYDFDELITPNKTHSLKAMLRDLFDSRPDAAGFSFYTVLHIKDWGRSRPENKLTLTQYLNRTRLMSDRTKLIFKSDKVSIGGATTHSIAPKSGYKSIRCPADIGFIRHYRHCRPGWKTSFVPVENNTDLCTNVNKRTEDTSMLEIASKVENNIMRVTNELFGSWQGSSN